MSYNQPHYKDENNTTSDYHMQIGSTQTFNNKGVISGTGSLKSNTLIEVSTGGVLNDVAGKIDDLRIPLESVKVGPASDPGYDIFRTGGTTKGVRAYHFDAASEEMVFFAVQLPHDRNSTAAITPHIHWSPTSTGSGVVRWGLEYTFSSINNDFPATTVIYTTGGTTGNEQYKHIYTAFADISTTAMTGNSAMIQFRLFRDAASTKDTYGADAAAHEFDIHYYRSKLGSVTAAGT